ncbi:MAG: RloB family protein [archaeon]|nr:RloB family protein [archaeon]
MNHISRVGPGYSRDTIIRRIDKTGRITDLSEKRTVSQKFFFAFEGITEYDYFEGIRRNFVMLNRHGKSVDLQLIKRDFCIKDMSGAEDNLQMIRDYTHALLHPDQVAPGIALARMLTDVYEMTKKKEFGYLHDTEEWKKYQVLHGLFLKILDKVKNSDCFDGRRFISDVDEFEGLVVDELRKNGVPDAVFKRVHFPSYKKGYNPETDRLCLVIDRDFSNAKNVEWTPQNNKWYRELIRKCQTDSDDEEMRHVRLFVSNPCFEMWLILHFDESLKFSKDMKDTLWFNKKGGEEGNMKPSFHIISQLILDHYGDTYTKDEIDFDKWFKDRVQNAVRNVVEGNYCTEVKKLNDNIGSNLGALLKDLIPLEGLSGSP